MRLLSAIGVLFVFAMALAGCSGHNSKKLPADIVHNPISAKEAPDTESLPMLTFDQEEHDFGKIIQGEVVTYGFKFRNTGEGDLVISKVSSSCGCTVTKYTEGIIRPGNKGVVEVTFNSEGRKGFQSKTINVISNTQPNTTTIRIKAQVVLPEE